MKKATNQDLSPAGCQRKTTIGGQALIEGLMMIGPDRKVMAVRKPDGSIFLEELPMTRWTGLANLPFLRGSVRLFRQLVSGTKALLRSAELLDEAAVTVLPAPAADGSPTTSAESSDVTSAGASSMETERAASATQTEVPIQSDATVQDGTTAYSETIAQSDATAQVGATAQTDPKRITGTGKNGRRTLKDRREALGQRIDHFLTHHSDVMLYISAVGGVLFSIILFILLPNLLASGISYLTGFGAGGDRLSAVLMNLIEGAIRIVIFIAYLSLASRMQEIERVWMYHGAEHKTIACYEAEMPLTVENARQFPRFHPRCGTSFMFIVILVSIVVFSLIGWFNPWINLLIRFVLVPVVAGIAYEIIRLAGRHDNVLTRIISTPGLWLQRLTTAEPNDSMLEVAIAAMEAVLPKTEGSDTW